MRRGGCAAVIDAAAATAAAAVCTPQRRRSFAFYVNLSDSADTQRYVDEQMQQLQQENKHSGNSTAYLHAMLNRTLAYYQQGDYVMAHAFAQRTHDKAHERNARSALTYFTALTCAHCAEALAQQYEAHMRARDAQTQTSVSLAMRPSAAFAAERAIGKLRDDAVRYRGIATRLYHRPDLAFLRGWGSGGGRGGATGDYRTGWCEDAGSVDADDEPAYGARWRGQRRQPEHAALRHYLARQGNNGTAPSSSTWHVPK